MIQPLVSDEQCDALLLAAARLVPREHITVLQSLEERLSSGKERAGAIPELVTLYAGLTIGSAWPEPTTSFDVRWRLPTGTQFCVEVTHCAPEGPPRISRSAQFREELRRRLQELGVPNLDTLDFTVVSTRGVALFGDPKEWPRFFRTTEFKAFAYKLSEGRPTKWTETQGKFVVTAQRGMPGKEPPSAEFHPFFRALKKKAAQLGRKKTDGNPTLVVLTATDAIVSFSRYPQFRGDLGGPCRAAFGVGPSALLSVKGGKLHDGGVHHHEKVSSVRVVSPGIPRYIGLHSTESLVFNPRARTKISLRDKFLSARAWFVTWRSPNYSPETFEEIARARRGALEFNLLATEHRKQAVEALQASQRPLASDLLRSLVRFEATLDQRNYVRLTRRHHVDCSNELIPPRPLPPELGSG